MTLFTIISHTPIWVWGLFVFLLIRGCVTLSEREISIRRLFILPLIFLAWGIWSVNQEFNSNLLSLTGMIAGLAIGIPGGWIPGKNQPRLKRKAGTGMIIRAGTPLTLMLIIIAFGTKYGLMVWLFLHPEMHYSAPFGFLFGLITGTVDGLFWGVTLNLFLSWRRTSPDMQQS